MFDLEAQIVADELATPVDLEAARKRAKAESISLGEALIAAERCDERPLYQLIARARGRRLVELDEVFGAIDASVVRSVPLGYQKRKRLVPLRRREGVLTVASCDPDPRLLDLADSLDCAQTKLWLITPTDLRRLRRACELDQVGGHTAEILALDPDLIDQEDLHSEGRQAALLDALIVDAVAERASDIHLERYANRVRIRLRVDGDLHDVERYRLGSHETDGIVNVLKVRASLDITEKRRPQGGRLSARVGGRVFDLRVQTLPSLHGEGVVIRLLPQDRERFDVHALGFSESLEAAFRKTLMSPSGLVLSVGPTGSGKTTTLYAGLQLLAHDARRKVLTVEDPIEYAVDGVHQTQVQKAIDYRFAGAVRSFVRHDPDVIFIGEIRDDETALEASRASQTGHLVLSTLHANDAVDAVQRLFDLGLHPNSIAAELRAVFAQRLVRRICPACREPHEPDAELLATLFPKGVPTGLRYYRGGGCERCHGRGSFGRVAVAESLVSTRELRLAIAHHRPLDELRQIAESSGLRPLREHAFSLMHAGVVELDDLIRVFPIELLARPD